MDTFTTATAQHQENAQRLVVFVGGFDPRGARHYHQLMRREAVKQSGVANANYQVGPRSRWEPGVAADLPHAAWTVKADNAQASDFVFLDWSDLVRRHWPQHTWQVVWDALRTYAVVARTRHVLPPLHQETPYVLWTLAYPLMYMLLCMLVAVGVLCGVMAGWPGGTGACAGLLAAALVLFGGYKLDKLLHVSWLLRILNFARRSAQQPVQGLRERLDASAEVIAAQLQQGRYREVVVVGFSVGSAVALPFVHALRARLQAQPQGPQRVYWLTLGNCIPLFTLMPQADEVLRHPLFALAQDPDLYWVDISSPSDSVSFGMCQLVALSLPQAKAEELAHCVNPRHMCTPRFHKLFHPTTYRWLRRNKMRMHFQYLMASELPGAYDYFAMLTSKGLLMEFISKRLVR